MYICYTMPYTFERTVRHSVFVAQWLTHRTGVQEVPSSIPLHVHIYFFIILFFMVKSAQLHESFASKYDFIILLLTMYEWSIFEDL